MKIQSAKERLLEIVSLSYKIFQAKVVNGTIGNFENEASMQLQLGVIMKDVGLLYEWDENDKFTIRFEKKINLKEPTSKSTNGKARCDIYLELKTKNQNKKKEIYSIGIELKYFPKCEGETTTVNRKAILEDIQNLECYKQLNYIDAGYELVYTTNYNYADSNTRSKINIGCDVVVKKGDPNYEVELREDHTFLWDIYSAENPQKCFLKVEI